MELKEKLMHEARVKGICIDGYKLMHSYDRQGLIDYYLRTIDWSLKRNYPSLEFIRANFPDSEDNGIYVDKTFAGEQFSSRQIYVFHNCKGVLNVAMDYENAIIPMLYFANGCDITICSKQKNTPAIRVPVYVFGDNNVISEINPNVVFTIYNSPIIHE